MEIFAKISNNFSAKQRELLFPRDARFKVVEKAHVISPGYEFITPDGRKLRNGGAMEMTVKYVGTDEKTSILDKIKRFLHI